MGAVTPKRQWRCGIKADVAGWREKDRMAPIGERALSWVTKYLGEVRPAILLEPDDGTLFLTHEGQPFSAVHMALAAAVRKE
jgi:site-specific recombinase XerD